MDEEVLDFLEHFGVKGMRWGVRKERSQNSSSSEKSGWSTKKKLLVGGVGLAAVAAGAVAAKQVLGTDSSKSMESVKREMPSFKAPDKLPSPHQAFFDAKPQRDAHRAHLLTILKPDEFIRWDEPTLGYVIDPERGYNPHNNRFGRS